MGTGVRAFGDIHQLFYAEKGKIGGEKEKLLDFTGGCGIICSGALSARIRKKIYFEDRSYGRKAFRRVRQKE